MDSYIETQSELEPYMANKEVDGTMNDYMELMIQFGFLVLFGLAFPGAYIMAFFMNISEIQVDKYKVCLFSQRSIPKNARSIGSWFLILDALSFLGIFFNAGLASYTSSSVSDD